MLLALSVISAQGQALGAASYKVFDARGGSIGRIDGNDWVLPDPEKLVSGRHAQVRWHQGMFYVEDVSTNGTGLNAPDAVIPRGQLQPLQDGDRLFVGDYEILVQVLPESAAPPPPAPPAMNQYAPRAPAPLMPAAPAPVAAPPPPPMAPMPGAGGGALSDLFQPEAPAHESLVAPMPQAPPSLIPPGPLAAPRPVATPPPIAASSMAPASAPALPENWDLTNFSSPAIPEMPPVAPAPFAPPPLPPPLPPSGGFAPVAAPLGAHGTAEGATLLASLGLNPQQVPPDTLAQLGQILRVAIHGLMEVLVARKQVKDHFRMAMTIIRPVENNPLKFSPSVEDALYTLFVKRNPGYLGPLEAFGEAFDDLSFHQLAVLAGMRAAFFATLERFDPTALENAVNRAAGKKGGLFGGAKAGYWDSYRQHYEQMTHDSEGNFQQIFGEAFVRAYDDQIRKLQDARARRGKT